MHAPDTIATRGLPRRAGRHHAALAVGVAAVAYGLALAVLQRQPGASLAEPLFLLAVLGVAFPLLAWGLTRTRAAAPPPRHEPARLRAVLLYLAVFAVVVLGWGFSALQQARRSRRSRSSSCC